MPTVLRRDGFAVRIYTDDHAPAHVHCLHGGEEIIINLGDAHTAPAIREVKGMRAANARRAVEIVEENRETLLAEWRRIHG